MTSARSQPLPEWIEVGRIRGAHGVRGEIAVDVESDTDGRFDAGSVVWVDRQPIEILTSRAHKGQRLLTVAGVEQREQATELRGRAVEVPIDEVPPAPEGEYYYFELVGCRVVDDGEGDLGEIREVYEDGGGLLLEVERPLKDGVDDGAQQRLLVPFVRAHLIDVDLEASRVRTRLPQGLVELCTSTS